MGLFKKSKEELHKKGMEYFSQKDYSKAVKLFKEAADMGLAQSMYNYAILVENGLGCTVNQSEAETWYFRAAANGDDSALEWIRRHCGKNSETLLDALVMRGRNGDIPALLEAAEAYIKGEITEKNIDAADKVLDLVSEEKIEEYAGDYGYVMSLLLRDESVRSKAEDIIASLELAAYNGNFDGAIDLVNVHCYGQYGAEKNYAKAKEMLDILREHGDEEVTEIIDTLPEWYLCCGMLKKDSKNYEEAYALLKKGAEYGGDVCMVELAEMCMEGFGCQVNEKLALTLLETAGEQGNAEAVARSAMFYEKGIGCKADRKKAVALYRKSAEMGNSYGTAIYIPLIKDIEDPVERFNEAAKYAETEHKANGGHSLAELCGDMCRDGEGTDKNLREAENWYVLARKYGASPEIYVKLGVMYYKHSKDFERAIYWLEHAKKYQVSQKSAQGHLLHIKKLIAEDGIDE